MPGSPVILAAAWVVAATLTYAAIGCAVALGFAVFGAARAAGGVSVSVGARILLIPAAAALWPLVVRRWRAA